MKKSLKLKDVVNLLQNSRTKQFSYTLKKKAIKNLGLTPKQILEVNIFVKPQKRRKK